MRRVFVILSLALGIGFAALMQSDAAPVPPMPSDEQGFAACLTLFPGGAIPDTPAATLKDLCKTADGEAIFAVRFDTGRKIPAWTAHRLTVAQKAKIDADPAYAKRRVFFSADPELAETEQTPVAAYKNTGFNKGHLVRAQDMNWNAEAYRASYVMSNMAPQRGALNSGPWLGMEKAFQNLIKDKQMTLWSIAGVYGVPADRPTAPNCFYKIIVAQGTDAQGDKTYKTLSALFVNDDHDRKQTTWPRYVVPLERIRTRTGIDFFKGLDVEPGFDTAFWGITPPAAPADCE
ncbi:MAG: DNA/RNA non-specific endonuclease [Rhodospirillales bacterium]|nr:DNA/RNA non-specific endonuclease [Rhodospirillales bacterium]